MTARDRMDLDEALTRAGDGAFVIGPDGRIVLWNRAAEKILGYAAREVMGKSCCDIFVGRDQNGNRLCYRGCHVTILVKMSEPVQSFDMQTLTKSHRPVWLNVSVLTGSNGRGGTALTAHLFRDVTATKELLALVQERLAPPAPPLDAGGGTLTRRELQVLRLLASGGNTRAIADGLRVSPATVRNHVQNVLAKLGAHSRLEAVAYANRHRLL
jgi:PAS domain S-box-containing protein